MNRAPVPTPTKVSAKKTGKVSGTPLTPVKDSAKKAGKVKVSDTLLTPAKDSVKKAGKVKKDSVKKTVDTKVYVDTITFASDIGNVDVGHYGYDDSMKNESCEKQVRNELSQISASQLSHKRPEKPPQIESRAIECNASSSTEDSG